MQDTTMSNDIVSVQGVSKRFGSVLAVDDVSFGIPRNEFFALLGPSGCGKTTLLRIIAGLEHPDDGAVIIDGEDMAGIPPNRRPVNMVFQSYAVFPHMTVAQNVAYGLRVTGTPRAEVSRRVDEALEIVQLAGLAGRKPHQLSGGQRQRVALARALVKRPKVLLLDEPLSALDAKLREQMRLELANLQQQVGITFIIVTHDQDEALSMADRIAVMNEGRVCQTATPDVLYESPASRFVAEFIGKVNLFESRVLGANGRTLAVEVGELGALEVPHEKAGPREGAAIALAVRPEKLTISTAPPDGDGRARLAVAARVTNWAYYGDTSHMYVRTEKGLELNVNIQNTTRDTAENLNVGDAVWVSWAAADMIVLEE